MFHEVAKGSLPAAQLWGRASMDGLVDVYRDKIIEENNPLGTINQFTIIYQRFISFKGFAVEVVGDNHAKITISRDFGELAVEAYSQQMLGAFQRLVELSGATGVTAEFSQKSWRGDQHTVVDLQW